MPCVRRQHQECGVVRSCTRLPALIYVLRRSLPAAPERPNEVDAGCQLQGIEIERLELRLQERGLRGDDGEVVGCTLLVERQGKVQRTLRGVDRGLLLYGGVMVVVEGGEAVFDLLKRADDDAAVIRGGGVEFGARLGDLRAAQTAVEHAEQGIRSDRPERARRAQPVRGAGALEAALGAERERGKKRRTRDPDVGIGRNHAPLRAGDVRTALQQGSRDAAGNLWQLDIDDLRLDREGRGRYAE